MKVNTIKKLAVLLFAVPLMTAAFVGANAAGQTAPASAADTYASKCKMCHGPKAEKLFDASKPEAEMIEPILKGKKAEKPPNMPSYEAKGITSEQATELAAYMKSLKQ